MNDILIDILEHKKKLIEQKQAFYQTLRKNIKPTEHTQYGLFKKAISKPGQINLIAEIKKASPSVGVIRERFDPVDLGRIYSQCGAAAISVLTEDKYFLGKPPYVRHVSDTVFLPVLTKDFFIDENQIFETFSQGSSAILLIAAILDDNQLKSLMDVAGRLDLDCLVEVHEESELQRALKAGAEIIGINHRNLRTLEMDMSLSERLIPLIPKDKVIVAESGIKSYAEIKKLQDLGVHAVLIGETFLRAENVAAKVKEVMGKQ